MLIALGEEEVEEEGPLLGLCLCEEVEFY